MRVSPTATRLTAILALTLVPFAPFAENSAPEPTACTVEGLLEQMRAGIHQGSLAYQRYLKTLIKEASLTLSASALTNAFNQERDPAVIELLGSALATKASHSESPALIQALLSRAASDGDPAARAAAIRGLRATGSVETMAANGDTVNYQLLIHDASPEVRRAVVENLVAESSEVYSGHDQRVSEVAVRTAAASADPEAAASILSQVSMEKIGPEAVQDLERMLRSDEPRLRSAAATALGGVPGREASSARSDLLSRYREERDPAVGKAILQALAQQGQSNAIPWLQELRGVAPGLDSEIDAWLSVLKLGLQEWQLVLREKQRRQR